MSTGEPISNRAPAPRPSFATPAAMLGCLSGLLIVIVLAGAVFSWLLIDRRSDTIFDLEAQVAALTAANLDLQNNVAELTVERDEFARRVESAIENLDSIRVERDDLTSEISRIELRLDETESLLADRDRQLSDLRQEGLRQVERVDDLESLRAILLEIIIIDDEIHDEFITLVDLIFTTFDLIDEGDLETAETGWEMTIESIERLDQLLATRDQMLSLVE
jgi:chromosome segregation ATPase